MCAMGGGGGHVGSRFAGSFGYADDVALIDPSLYALKKLTSVCESYEKRNHIILKTTKSKLLFYNIHSSLVAQST